MRRRCRRIVFGDDAGPRRSPGWRPIGRTRQLGRPKRETTGVGRRRGSTAARHLSALSCDLRRRVGGLVDRLIATGCAWADYLEVWPPTLTDMMGRRSPMLAERGRHHGAMGGTGRQRRLRLLAALPVFHDGAGRAPPPRQPLGSVDSSIAARQGDVDDREPHDGDEATTSRENALQRWPYVWGDCLVLSGPMGRRPCTSWWGAGPLQCTGRSDVFLRATRSCALKDRGPCEPTASIGCMSVLNMLPLVAVRKKSS